MSFPFWRRLLFSLGLARLAVCLAPAATVSLPPAAIAQELRFFRTTGSVLYVAAHPDDENTELITAFSRGRGYRTAYLSLTRGDGGQNELGPEFGEKLGVARTQELLAARRRDGGQQFFTRAIDFGFSKSPEETLGIWDRSQVLGDVVRVIRKFQPDVIITRFPIPPGSGGHGHHTASAILAVEAFKLAGDPLAYPEQIAQGLKPWQPKRVGWNRWDPQPGRDPGPLTGPTVRFDIGGVDPVSGEPFGTIANQSRAMHKTQGLGGFATRAGGPGPNLQNFLLLAGDPPAADIMDGVDTTWSRVPGGAELIPLIDAAIAGFNLANPSASVPALLTLRTKLQTLPRDALIDDKRRAFDRIIQSCLGLVVETTLPQAEEVPGEKLSLRHKATVTSLFPVRWISVRYPSLKAELKIRTDLAAGQPVSRDTTRALPRSTPLSQPYWLRHEGTTGMFQVDDPLLIGEPENPPAFPVEFVFEVGGQTIAMADEPVQLMAGAPPAQAQRRLTVIPPVSLGFASELELFAPGAIKEVTVEITAARAGSTGTLRLDAPADWKIYPATHPFNLARIGDKSRLSFKVTAPDQTGSANLIASAEIGGVRYGTERYLLNYAHLPLQLLQHSAQIKAVSCDFRIRGQRIGYLPGAGDSLAENLTQLGYAVTPLTGADLTPEKLHGLDAVVIGVRAFNERDDLAQNLPALYAWVEAGGTVVAQYNRPNGLKAPQLGPYKLSIEGPAPALRVTDETAPVTILAPDHPVLNSPNKIVPADFDGWVQERGAYFPSSWDEEHYVPIFAMNDPGEKPLKSSLLIAKHGKGYYVYTGLSFFRQLPAGTPGAYRLFANLISLGK
jgi:LmbE family N-acetylglucosaminyl deacetylase